jgi:hypothetical protein
MVVGERLKGGRVKMKMINRILDMEYRIWGN